MDRRFVLFYKECGRYEYDWFETENEIKDFVAFYKPDDIHVIHAIEVLDSREIDLTV